MVQTLGCELWRWYGPADGAGQVDDFGPADVEGQYDCAG